MHRGTSLLELEWRGVSVACRYIKRKDVVTKLSDVTDCANHDKK